MASYLQVENISKSYGDRTLFENISFNINEGDKIALVAPNGTGKSSLLKILAGVEHSDRGGEVKFMKDIRVAFLDQDMTFDPKRTIFDEVYSRMGNISPELREYEDAIKNNDYSVKQNHTKRRSRAVIKQTSTKYICRLTNRATKQDKKQNTSDNTRKI